MKIENKFFSLTGLAVIVWVFFTSDHIIFKIWALFSLGYLALIIKEREEDIKDMLLEITGLLHFMFTEFFAIVMLLGGERFFTGAIIFMFIGLWFAAIGESGTGGYWRNWVTQPTKKAG